MKPIALCLALLPTPLLAQADIVGQTLACLARPIADNQAFNRCLSPLDRLVFEEKFDDADALAALTRSLNAGTQGMSERMQARWTPAEVDSFNRQITAELEPLFVNCLNYELNVEQNSDALAIARCNIVAEFATLHFLYDNYYSRRGNGQ